MEPLPSEVVTTVVEGPLPEGRCSCLFRDAVRSTIEEEEEDEKEEDQGGKSGEEKGEEDSDGDLENNGDSEPDDAGCYCRFVFRFQSQVSAPVVIDYFRKYAIHVPLH